MLLASLEGGMEEGEVREGKITISELSLTDEHESLAPQVKCK